eukprot:1852888-Pleurochrysis_carterae.AAC.3
MHFTPLQPQDRLTPELDGRKGELRLSRLSIFITKTFTTVRKLFHFTKGWGLWQPWIWIWLTAFTICSPECVVAVHGRLGRSLRRSQLVVPDRILLRSSSFGV